MSLRAYKLIEIVHEKKPSFNLSRCPLLAFHLEESETILTIQDGTLDLFAEKLEDYDRHKLPYDQNTKEDYLEIVKQIREDMGEEPFVEYCIF